MLVDISETPNNKGCSMKGKWSRDYGKLGRDCTRLLTGSLPWLKIGATFGEIVELAVIEGSHKKAKHFQFNQTHNLHSVLLCKVDRN
jgi:hypothetical protein